MRLKSNYVGIFLEPESVKRLLAAAPPKHSCVFAEHVTIARNVDFEHFTAYEDAEAVTVRVMGFVEDARGQAVLVSILSDKIECKGRMPHITISTEEFTTPAYSNRLIETASTVHRLPGPDLILGGHVKVCSTWLAR